MTADQFVDALTAKLGDIGVQAVPSVDQAAIAVPRAHIVQTFGTLRSDPAFAFDLLSELTAVDWWPGEPRFQVIYHLTSIAHGRRLRVKVAVSGDDAHMPTVTGLWPAAGWLEREVFDLFGIIFDGHADLRRVLMPEDWEGYPLRKDYPVQITMPVKIYEPLEISAEDFQKNIENDRRTRQTVTDRNQPAR